MAKKTTKKEYIKSITERYAGLESKFKEVAKLRKNHKQRINPAYTSGITSIGNLAGIYKRGSRAGQLKINQKSLNQLTANELKRLDRLMELQQNRNMYSSLDKQIREEAWDLAFSSFKNASRYSNKEQGVDIERRRRGLTEEDYRNMIYLFEKMEGDYLHAYGSDVAEQLYEETEGEYDASTLFDVMTKGLEIGKSAGSYNSKYNTSQNRVAQEFLWHWSSYVSENPRAKMSDIEDEFIKLLVEGEV